MKIIFTGTPQFAVPSLELLVKEGFNICCVVTAPGKPAGRGLKVIDPPVKTAALKLGLQILQPVNLKDPHFLEELRRHDADLMVVIAFRMLPEAVWKMPRMGAINLHASLLPDYRGAAPINWAIINGEQETGMTTFFLKHEIDTGDILFTGKVEIGHDETAGELHDRMMVMGAGLVLKTVAAIRDGKASPSPQMTGGNLHRAPRIQKDDCKIDFMKPSGAVRNLIRGLSPRPGAWCRLEGKMLKIFKASLQEAVPLQPPGTLSTDGKTTILAACGSGWISLEHFQLEGKKAMDSASFLRGHTLKSGQLLE